MLWHQLDHMQTICMSLQTVNHKVHINISSLFFSSFTFLYLLFNNQYNKRFNKC